MKKILAIDDQPDNLVTIKAVLKNRIENISIITASSGRKGIELAESEQPDTILLDIIMPEMDGYDVCQILKKNEKTKHIPIILVTAIKTDADSRVKGLMLGADAFLPKPIDPIELSTQVKVMLRIKEAEDILRKENVQLDELVKEKTHKLQESEIKYRGLYDNAPIPYQSLSPEGNIIDVNPNWLETLGYERHEVIGKNFSEFLHPEWSKLFPDRFKNFKKAGRTLKVDFKMLHKTGEYLDVEYNGVAAYNPDGTFKQTYCVFENVTEKKLIEHQKYESERKLNTLINNLQGIAYRCRNDEDWTMEYLSAGFELITGYKIEDVINNNKLSFNQMIHIDDQAKVAHDVQTALDSKTAFNISYRLISATGDELNVIEKGIGISSKNDGNIDYIEGFINDVSEITKAKEEIIRLSSAVEQSPSVIVVTDPQGNLVYANAKFTELTGYSSKELIGQKSNILKSGEQPESYYQDLWETITRGEIWKGEFHNRKKDGTLFWESAIISPITDENGEVINYMKLAEDITSQKEAKKALAESETRYHKLISTSAEGFWLIDENGFTKEVNRSLCTMLGYEKEEIIGKKPYDFVDKFNNKIFKEQLAIADSKKQRTYEISLTTKSGQKIPTMFNATSITNEQGEFIGSFAFVTDLSISKRDELIQKILYNISNAAITTDSLSDFLKQIRHELNPIIDTQNFYIALYDDNDDKFLLPYMSDERTTARSFPANKTLTKYVLSTNEPLLVTKTDIDKLTEDGLVESFGPKAEVWLGVPLKKNNEPIGVFAIQNYESSDALSMSDLKMMEFVSEQVSILIVRKQTEQEIISSLEKAKESDRLKTAFLQNISHEIRTPMNGIMGFTSLLKDSNLSGEEQQSYIDVIMISGKRMLNTLNDLMDMSMLETGQVKMNTGPTNLDAELTSLYDFFKLEVNQKGLELNYHCPNELVSKEIYTDRDKIVAVCTNLIKNAIKYSTQGRIDFGIERKGKFVQVYIKDTGIGIPKNRIKAIFERFVQADLEDVKVHEGTGLGLSISKAYIELLGGEIWVESTVNKGSQFYFTLPYNPVEKEGGDDNDTNLAEDKDKKRKILIAEDEDFASEYLGIILESPDTILYFAKDGIEAVDMCKQNPDIDLVLMDIKLPKLNGYSATKAIREFNSNVPIIAQTAYALAGDREKAIEAGCNDHITKPINKDVLYRMIEELID